MRRAVLVLTVCLGCALAGAQPFDIHALLGIARISDPQLSPDSALVAFTVQRAEVAENRFSRQIYVIPLAGGEARQITSQGSNYRARWSPDGRKIVYLSTASGSPQIWEMDPDGGNARRVSDVPTGVEAHTLTPDGKSIVFTSYVYPGCADENCNRQKLEAEAASKVKARIYQALLYRHWNEWQGARRKHILIMGREGGAARDLTPGNLDVPTFSLGGGDDFAISPDSTLLAYVMNPDANQAVSTNTEIYLAPLSGGEAVKITESLGADRTPTFSPDGKRLAYRSQERAGYESDRWRLMLYELETKRTVELSAGMDRNVQSIVFSPDGGRIFFTLEDRGRQSLHMMSANGGGARVIISGNVSIDDVQFAPDGRTMLYSEQSGAAPVDLFRVSSAGGTPIRLTQLNEELLARYRLSRLEEFTVESVDKQRVQSFLVKPPDFDAARKYPALVLIHGGPQSAWREAWSYRWNPQIFAQAGFVVVMPNPRGSTGFGQRFTDEINQDWGGKVYADIMAVTDYVERLPYVDKERMCAAGGSFGGYMVNWILGHSNRFRALVSHAGVFDLRSMAGETEELWFPYWEFGGPPWERPEVYERWSPSNFIREFKTPTLVIHGELDYRVPYGQGLQLFTALQMRNVPSKLLLFPDEGHWILKPQNSILWHTTFLDWIQEWTKTGG